MKQTALVIALVVLIAGGSYFAYSALEDQSIYQLTLSSELNSADFQKPGTQSRQTREVYIADGLGYFHVDILEFSDVATAGKHIAQFKQEHNPSMLVLDTKYVHHYQDPLMEGFQMYFYQSEKNIVMISYKGTKDNADAFVGWYYSKYPNQ